MAPSAQGLLTALQLGVLPFYLISTPFSGLVFSYSLMKRKTENGGEHHERIGQHKKNSEYS